MLSAWNPRGSKDQACCRTVNELGCIEEGSVEEDELQKRYASMSGSIAGSGAGRNMFTAAGFSIAGGGETLSAINKFINKDDVSYCSTGGGAFLEFMEGKDLPSIQALKAKI